MYINQYANYDPTKSTTYNFYGLNRTRRTSKGEFDDMRNMSSHEYPCAAPRLTRKVLCRADVSDAVISVPVAPCYSDTSSITGFTGIANGGFYYNGILKSDGFYLNPKNDWSIVRRGDDYYMNGYAKGRTVSDIFVYHSSTGKFEPLGTCYHDLVVRTSGTTGKVLEVYISDNSNPECEFTTAEGRTMTYSDFTQYIYSLQKEVYQRNKDNYTNYRYACPFEDLYQQDVMIVGFPAMGEGDGCIFKYDGKKVTTVTGDYSYGNTVDVDALTAAEIKKLSNQYHYNCRCSQVQFSYVRGKQMTCNLYFEMESNGTGNKFWGLPSTSGDALYFGGISIIQKRPSFAAVEFHNGRLWGVTPNGNRIYASSSTDITSFSSTDISKMFAARLQNDAEGTFAGICEYGSEVLVFTESAITIVSGDNPTNYYTNIIKGIGCIDPKSIVATPSGVIFLSYNGFYVYSGNLPQCLSVKLNTKYLSAVAGFNDDIYYASAVRADTGERELLTYDTRYGLWHVCDDFCPTGFFAFAGKWYATDKIFVYEMNSSDGLEVVEWSFTTAPTHDNTLDMKAPEELWIRCEMDEGAKFTVYSRVDDDEFKEHLTFSGSGKEIFRCPIRVRMGYYYQWKIKGRGKVVFYEIEAHKAFGGRQYKETKVANKPDTGIESKNMFY